MPPHDAASNGNSDWSRLRKYVEKTAAGEDRDRPGLASCKGPVKAAPTPAHDDEEDGPITTRWAAG